MTNSALIIRAKKWKVIKTIDAHAAGEPLRVVLAGIPKIPGKTILEKRRYFQKNLDHFRRGLMWEPRGHTDMYGAIITEPVSPKGELGVLFLHNEGLSSMCGHGIIALTTVVLETGILPMKIPQTEVKLDAPAGLITALAYIEKGSVKSVRFHNVPSFVLALDETVDVHGLGEVRYDLAFGGAFYAYVQAEDIGLELTTENYRRLIEKGMTIKRAIMQSRSIIHPFEKDLNFLYGTIFIGSSQSQGVDSQNVCVFAEGEVDRSPTGTGISGRLAIHFARGEIELHQPLVIESIIGTRFTGRVVEETSFGPYKAIIPEIEGSAFIIARSEFSFDSKDPLCYGFFLR